MMLAENTVEPFLIVTETQCKPFFMLAEIFGKQFSMSVRTIVQGIRISGSINL